MLRIKCLTSVGLLLMLCLVPVAGAAGLTNGNILVGIDRLGVGNTSEIREYTRAGTFVQSWVVTGDEGFTDLTVTQSMKIAFYHGSAPPDLTILDPVTGTSTDMSLAGWSTIGNVSYGGVAAIGDVVVATDMKTANEGAPNGLIRFDTAPGGAAPQRFLDRSGDSLNFRQSDFSDVTLGHDGKLYALRGGTSPSPNSIEVIDPLTMASLGQKQLPGGDDIRGIAVAADGSIFAATWGDFVVKYSAAGVELGRIDSNINGLSDIDISADGTVMASLNAQVFFTDLNLATSSNFTVPGVIAVTGFTAFVEPPPPVPEPGLLLLLIPALALRRGFKARPSTAVAALTPLRPGRKFGSDPSQPCRPTRPECERSLVSLH